MNTKKIITAWLSTVIFGSILLALFFSMSTGSFGIFFLVSTVISGVLSLPTLIVQLVVNSRNTYQEPRKHTKAVNISHLIMFLITLLVGNLFIALAGGALYAFFTGITTFYAVTATIIWFVILKNTSQDQ